LALMNVEAGLDTPRLKYIFDTKVEPALTPQDRLIDYLAAEGRIRPVSLRSLHFLVAHGAAAPFTLWPLARLFNPMDPSDPAEVTKHADLIADIITEGLRTQHD
ncbi:MAG: hypothetical protein QOF58_4187, partial [Pseudonocardiales bacterium]|nr:hypothetical protein [Pseudonocardiales bacterium]